MESFVTSDGVYRIEPLSSSTVPGALRAIREDFCQDENVCNGLEVNINPKAAEELAELCADAALDGVSLVAVVVETGEVAAACFNKIQVKASSASEKPFFEIFAEERCTQASSRSLVQFMADVDEKCDFFEKFDVDCSFELMFLVTTREHRKKNLGTLLCKLSIDLARKLKDSPIAPFDVKDLGPEYSHLKPHEHVKAYPKICQAIFTGKATQRIGKKLNFTVYLTVPYTECIFEGKTYSERIGDEKAFCVVTAQKLY